MFFTGRMPFLPPNQQRQSTEGIIQSQRGLKWVVLNWTGLQHCQSPWVDVNVNVNVEINVTAGHHVEVYGRKGEGRMTRWHHHHQQQQQQQQQQ